MASAVQGAKIVVVEKLRRMYLDALAGQPGEVLVEAHSAAGTHATITSQKQTIHSATSQFQSLRIETLQQELDFIAWEKVAEVLFVQLTGETIQIKCKLLQFL